jgi:nitrogen fixation protein NifB
MSVLGVAGPGDPLANPRRTFRTLELVRRACPDLKLCLSTNGLRLAEYADRIAELGVEHVTVTINMIDPDIGARIYEWVAWRGRLYRGREAAKILSERQLEGLQALADRQILTKVNSVLIPGINDDHLPEVSRVIRGMGAFLHNVMPLVSAPEHGTVFGLAGQRGPTPAELRALQDRCEAAGESMTVMRHCRQCRADAVGLLGQDHGERYGPEAYQGREISYDLIGRERLRVEIERWRQGAQQARESLGINTTGAGRPERVVLVAVATKGGGVVNQHFGHATEFSIYEAAEGWAKLVQIRQVARYCGPTAQGTNGPGGGDTRDSTLDSTVRLLSDCAAVLCSKIGPAPREALTAAGIQPMEVYDLVDQAVAAAGAALIHNPAKQAGPIPSRA